MHTQHRIAYVLKVFPRFSQTFVVNEILAHEAAGLPLEIISMRLTDDVRFHESLAAVRSPVTHVRRPPGKAAGLLAEMHQTAQLFPNTWEEIARNPETSASDLHQALALARLIHKKDIKHLHAHFGTIATTTSRIAAAIAGISYAFTAHAKDIYHESVDPLVLRKKLGDAARVITVSDYNIRYLRENYGEQASNVVHINNGLPLKEFPFKAPTQRPPLILAVGRLVEKKGFEPLIRACQLLRERGQEFRCEIAGDGVLKPSLAQLIDELSLGDHVKLLGPLPQGEVRRRLHEAALLAAPCVVAADQDRDGLPTILLEAMAMGTPCISTDVTGIPEIIEHEKTGLFVAQNDAQGLADACARLMADPDLSHALAYAAREQIEQRFDAEKNAAQIRSLVAEIIEEARH